MLPFGRWGPLINGSMTDSVEHSSWWTHSSGHQETVFVLFRLHSPFQDSVAPWHIYVAQMKRQKTCTSPNDFLFRSVTTRNTESTQHSSDQAHISLQVGINPFLLVFSVFQLLQMKRDAVKQKSGFSLVLKREKLIKRVLVLQLILTQFLQLRWNSEHNRLTICCFTSASFIFREQTHVISVHNVEYCTVELTFGENLAAEGHSGCLSAVERISILEQSERKRKSYIFLKV